MSRAKTGRRVADSGVLVWRPTVWQVLGELQPVGVVWVMYAITGVDVLLALTFAAAYLLGGSYRLRPVRLSPAGLTVYAPWRREVAWPQIAAVGVVSSWGNTRVAIFLNTGERRLLAQPVIWGTGPRAQRLGAIRAQELVCVWRTCGGPFDGKLTPDVVTPAYSWRQRWWGWPLFAAMLSVPGLMVFFTLCSTLSVWFGIAVHLELPWGLLAKTTGDPADGASTEFGGGILVVPPLAFAITWTIRELRAHRVPSQRAGPS